jgi:signal transduction histidine kinase
VADQTELDVTDLSFETITDEDLIASSDGVHSYPESVADDGHQQRRQFRAWLIALAATVGRHRLRALLVAIAIELAFLIPIGLVPTSRYVLGMPGSLLALIVVLTAVLAGWQAGLAAAIAGGIIFWGTVADFGAQSAPITTVISTGIWVAAALISGLLADALRDQTQRRKAAAVALARAETLREHEAERAAQEERTRIARDLHDSVTQSLFAATLKAEALTVGGDPAQLEATAEDVRRLSRGSLAQMRTLLLELRGDPVEEVPLQQLLRNVAEATESRASVKVVLALSEGSALPPRVHEAVYRITQEALNNVVRHAKAQNAWVQLDSEPWHARLLIGDDGCGFDPGASVDSSHTGLRTTRERAGDSGGRLTVRSVQGEGTELTVEWRFEEPIGSGA